MDVIYILERNETAAKILSQVLSERDLGAWEIVPDLPDELPHAGAGILDMNVMAKPYRIGELIDRINELRQQDVRPKMMHFEKCGLDTIYCLFYSGDGQAIKLTEKETEILVYLATHSHDSPVKRDDLLEAVWGYGNNIETHTLETHIYRLRQKIETDPAAPDFLITTDEGYIFPA